MAANTPVGRLDVLDQTGIDALNALAAKKTDIAALAAKKTELLALAAKSEELLALLEDSQEVEGSGET